MKRRLIILVLLVGANSSSPAQNQTERTDPPLERRLAQTASEDWTKPAKFELRLGPGPLTRFKARLEITNISVKKIKQVSWSCTLRDVSTNRIIATQTFVTRKKISPKKDAVLFGNMLVETAALHGPRVVSATNPDKYDTGTFQAFQVNKILEIKFTDGSVETPP